MRTFFLMSVVSVLASGCTPLVGMLDECETSTDCANDWVCAQRVCVAGPRGCGTTYGPTTPDAIQFGVLVPLNTSKDPGANIDESEEQALNAVQLALEEINQRGIGDKKIALHVCNTATDEELTLKQAEWLMEKKQVVAVLTAGSAQSNWVAKVTTKKGVLTMSYSATASELTSLQDTYNGSKGLFWRTASSDVIQAAIMAKLLHGGELFKKPSRVGILYVRDMYGQGLYNLLDTQLKNYPVFTKGYSYDRQGEVIEGMLRSLDMFDPDVTVLIGFAGDVSTILQKASTLRNLKKTPDLNHRWFFSDSVKDAAFLANPTAAAQAEGFFGTGPAHGEGQAFKIFQENFQVRFQKDPSEYSYTSNAYDAMYLLALSAAYSQGTIGTVTGTQMAEGLTKVSTGPSSIRTQLTPANFTYLAEELAAGREVNVEGTSGPLDFDDTGDVTAPMELWKVENMTFSTIKTNVTPH